jgi:hypothetical protein
MPADERSSAPGLGVEGKAYQAWKVVSSRSNEQGIIGDGT